MTMQKDFWKPAPFDFEAIVKRVDVSSLPKAHTDRAAKHCYTESKWRSDWNFTEPHHDRYDLSYFDKTSLAAAFDVWDNRNKGAKQ
jgi:hypothetical protein